MLKEFMFDHLLFLLEFAAEVDAIDFQDRILLILSSRLIVLGYMPQPREG
jgi:hypothetical protein